MPTPGTTVGELSWHGGRYLAAAVAIVLFAFVGGFVIFASSIAHYAPSAGLQADGIVVLTGGEHRLSEAARLLAEVGASGC